MRDAGCSVREERTERTGRGDSAGIWHVHAKELQARNTGACTVLTVSLSSSGVQLWESRVVGELTCLPAHKPLCAADHLTEC